jgi:orotidine-5'-phosphate decarboxylase
VAGGIRALAPLRAAIINVHASGGAAMMRAAIEAARQCEPAPRVIAVTILTSLDDEDLEQVGYADARAGAASNTQAHAVGLAGLAQRSGLDGVVCSARDLDAIRAHCGPDFLTVVPGIRPAQAGIGDQKRVATPGRAVQQGADILVVGRPITQAEDPVAAAQSILAECRAAAAA